jgi:hypothetical protein
LFASYFGCGGQTFSLGSQNLEQRRSSGQHLDQKDDSGPNFNKL